MDVKELPASDGNGSSFYCTDSSKDSFTKSFSALQLPELINSQTILHIVHDSGSRSLIEGRCVNGLQYTIICGRRSAALSGIHALKLLHGESVLCAQ